MSVHLKDQAVREYEDGFLLADVPLGQGDLDLMAAWWISCASPGRRCAFSLELIMRDPLKVPCLTERYWATLPSVSGRELRERCDWPDREQPDSCPRSNRCRLTNRSLWNRSTYARVWHTHTSIWGCEAMLPGIKQFDLTSRAAVVTGGSKGLGEAMAAGLASAGADVLLVSRHEAEAVAAAQRIASDFGRRAVGMRADVTVPGDCQAMADRALAELGRIDILVNNAGVNIRGPIDELSYEQFREVQQVNVDGLWLATRAVVPTMKKAGYGRIINLASTLGVVGLEDRTPYTASKGAVVQMTRALGLELAPFGICVNAICPGPFLTPMNVPIAEAEQTKRSILGAVALGRWGRMEEIQGAVILLSSDAASYMVGSLLIVDGGWTAR